MKKSWAKNLIDTMEIDGNTVSIFELESVKDYFPDSPSCFVGIDPGYRHFGFTISYFTSASICEVQCRDFSDQLDRAISLMTTSKEMVSALSLPGESIYLTIMEGSSHAEKFGQTSLAEARLSLALGVYKHKPTPKIDGAWSLEQIKFVPPSTIRKGVFGKGNIRGEDYWKNELPPNAAASLCCSIYGSKLYQKENT